MEEVEREVEREVTDGENSILLSVALSTFSWQNDPIHLISGSESIQLEKILFSC